MSKWIKYSEREPANGVTVMTKLSPPDRNEQLLQRRGNLWFYPDGSAYVYYTPTHWMPISEPPKEDAK